MYSFGFNRQILGVISRGAYVYLCAKLKDTTDASEYWFFVQMPKEDLQSFNLKDCVVVNANKVHNSVHANFGLERLSFDISTNSLTLSYVEAKMNVDIVSSFTKIKDETIVLPSVR